MDGYLFLATDGGGRFHLLKNLRGMILPRGHFDQSISCALSVARAQDFGLKFSINNQHDG